MAASMASGPYSVTFISHFDKYMGFNDEGDIPEKQHLKNCRSLITGLKRETENRPEEYDF